MFVCLFFNAWVVSNADCVATVGFLFLNLSLCSIFMEAYNWLIRPGMFICYHIFQCLKYTNPHSWQHLCCNDLQSSDQLSEYLLAIIKYILISYLNKSNRNWIHFFMNTSNMFSSLIILTLKFHFNNPILQALQTLKVLKQKLS